MGQLAVFANFFGQIWKFWGFDQHVAAAQCNGSGPCLSGWWWGDWTPAVGHFSWGYRGHRLYPQETGALDGNMVREFWMNFKDRKHEETIHFDHFWPIPWSFWAGTSEVGSVNLRKKSLVGSLSGVAAIDSRRSQRNWPCPKFGEEDRDSAAVGSSKLLGSWRVVSEKLTQLTRDFHRYP